MLRRHLSLLPSLVLVLVIGPYLYCHCFTQTHPRTPIRRPAIRRRANMGVRHAQPPEAAHQPPSAHERDHSLYPAYSLVGIKNDYWHWRPEIGGEMRELPIRYQFLQCESEGQREGVPSIICVHGFGGNCDHWRRNVRDLAKNANVYTIDLLGYGYSAKPNPRELPPNTIYNFHVWAEQLRDFTQEVVNNKQRGSRSPTYLVCNSVGGVAGLQQAVSYPHTVDGVLLLDISLRLLNERKQSPLQRPFVRGLQWVLRETQVGQFFFSRIAQKETVRNVLKQAYFDDTQVTDELVDAILTPGLLPGAAEVFLDFISYSSGPLPEDLLPQTNVPVWIAWGENDPWEPIDMGRDYEQFECVEEFIVLGSTGHCPMDESPSEVNALIERFIQRMSARRKENERERGVAVADA